MKVVVVNTKGGVGKSTVSGQVVAPWLFLDSERPVSYFEYDDCNRDGEVFKQTKVFTYQHRNIVSNVLADRLAEDVLSPQNGVIDIGGNRTADMVLQALSDSGVAPMIDAFVVPLMDGEQDAINAVLTYRRIREMAPESPIVFALSRYNPMRDLETQFFQFVGCAQGPMKHLGATMPREVSPADQNLMVIDDDDSIVYARVIGKTIYEIAMEQKQNGGELEAQLKTCVARGDREGALACSWRIRVRKGMVRYLDKVLMKAFEKLDTVVKQREPARENADGTDVASKTEV